MNRTEKHGQQNTERTIIVTARGQGFSDEESSRGKKYPHTTT